MQKIFLKRTVRNFCKNWPRYCALMMMIILSLFAVVSTTVSSETIITQSELLSQKDYVEDGEFQVFVPLSSKDEKKLKKEGIVLERMFSLDYHMNDESVLRIFKERKDINKIHIVEGNLPQNKNEILLERRYAEVHDYEISDVIRIGSMKLTVSGIGTTPDYEAPLKTLSGGAINSESFGLGFLSDQGYNHLTDYVTAISSPQYVYAYRLNEAMTHNELKTHLEELPLNVSSVDDQYFKKYWKRTLGKEADYYESVHDLIDGAYDLKKGLNTFSNSIQSIPFAQMGIPSFQPVIDEMKEGSQDLYEGLIDFKKESRPLIDELVKKYDIDNLQSFTEAEDNPRIGCAKDDQMINRSTALFAGAIIMMLFAYVISVFITHEIERDKRVIGTLYALGLNRYEILGSYLLLPIITTFVASLIGLICGSSDMAFYSMMDSPLSYFSLPNLTKIYPLGIILYALVVPVLMTIIVNCFVILHKLNQPALSMIQNTVKERAVHQMKLNHMSFVHRFRIRQLLREYQSACTILFGIFIAYLLLMLGLNCYTHTHTVSVDNKNDIAFEYMYTYKYPPEKVPVHGFEVCGMTTQMDFMDYKMDVYLMGIEEENPYFDLEYLDYQSEVVISDALATKFHLEQGDEFIVHDTTHQQNYAFTVYDIIDYSPSFMVFMDIDDMRTLMDVDDDYFNIVLSQQKLNIPEGELYSTLTSEDIIKSADVYLKMMEPMIYMMIVCSSLVFVFVMYLMMKVMIDRHSRHISLFRIFGYEVGEIRKLYLDGHFVLVAVGAAIVLPLAKFIMDQLYPYMSSDVASGIYLQFPWPIYIVIYGCTLLLYVIIDAVLMLKIRRIEPARILSERE